jgi:hypothetical protein
MSRYQLLNQMVDFHEIPQEGHVIKGELDATFFQSRSFNLSKMADVGTPEIDLKQSTWDHDILYADRSLKDGQILMRTFFAKK